MVNKVLAAAAADLRHIADEMEQGKIRTLAVTFIRADDGSMDYEVCGSSLEILGLLTVLSDDIRDGMRDERIPLNEELLRKIEGN